MSTAPNSGIRRHSASNPCRICGGWDGMKRGQGERCHGYLSTDGQYEHCSREDLSGHLAEEKGGTFAHRLQGECKCGRAHGPALTTFPPPRKGGAKRSGKARARGVEVARYGYLDEAGEFLFEVRRIEDPETGDKTFLQWSKDAAGVWVAGRKGKRTVPYRLPELLAANPEEAVWIVEGEKCVDDLLDRKLVATCNPGGAEKWDDAFSPHLAGRHVFILPDNDPADPAKGGTRTGWRHAEMVAASVAPYAETVKVVDLAARPEGMKLAPLPEKGDVYDFLRLPDATLDDLHFLADQAPEWEPEGSACEDAWEDPILVQAGAALAFPVHVYPAALAEMVAAGAATFPCPVDLVAMPVLVAAGGAVGRSVVVEIKPGWRETCSLFLCVVARTGMAKSPANDLVLSPLWEIERDLLAKHEREAELFEIAMALRAAKKSDEPAPKPSFPQRLITDQATVESLAPILQANPRGIVQIKDELKGLFGGMNQYKAGGKGDDRQQYLSLHSGQSFVVDRKSMGGVPIFVRKPFLSVYGGIQPKVLARLDGIDEEDGLFERFLFARPDWVPVRMSWASVDPGLRESWSDALRRLWGREMVEEKDASGRAYKRPFVVGMTEDAKRLFGEFFDANEIESESADFPEQLLGAWPKFRAACARLALVLEQLHWAYDPTSGPNPPPVGRRSVEGAIELVNYFKAHLRRVRNVAKIPDTQAARDGRAILAWAEGANLKEFTEREVRRNFPSRFPQEGPELTDALTWLQGRHCLRPVEVKASPRGRKPSPRYRLSPQLPKGGAVRIDRNQNGAHGDSTKSEDRTT